MFGCQNNPRWNDTSPRFAGSFLSFETIPKIFSHFIFRFETSYLFSFLLHCMILPQCHLHHDSHYLMINVPDMCIVLPFFILSPLRRFFIGLGVFLYEHFYGSISMIQHFMLH